MVNHSTSLEPLSGTKYRNKPVASSSCNKLWPEGFTELRANTV